jgi:exodeoxyribonuclease VII small subunit
MVGAESPEEPSFEQILARLSSVVERLEGGDLPLEESLAIFEEGIRLSRLGARRLDEAERRVEELLGDDGRTRPLAVRRDEDSSSPPERR